MSNLVSILIPAFNAEKWITHSIESALHQTWPNKEVIIVDDGSTDNTLQIAAKYESKSVKVFSQNNKGACAARNKALEFSQGDFIQWLDADDLLAPDKIAKQLYSCPSDKNSRVLLSSSFGFFHYRLNKVRIRPNSLWQDLTPVEWIYRKFSEGSWMAIESWLISRKLTEMADLWNEKLIRDNDGEYFCRVVAASEEIKFVPEGKSFCRMANRGSLSRAQSDRACHSIFLSLFLCIGYLRSLEDSDRTRSACLKHLQRHLIYFYPEKKDILREADDLARSLGGKLIPPEINWKYAIVRRILGWKMAKIAQHMMRNTKECAIINWDRLIFQLTGD